MARTSLGVTSSCIALTRGKIFLALRLGSSHTICRTACSTAIGTQRGTASSLSSAAAHRSGVGEEATQPSVSSGVKPATPSAMETKASPRGSRPRPWREGSHGN